MGWAVLILLLAVSLAALWLLGVRGGLAKAAAAALFLGAAGYALQGNPDLPGADAGSSDQREVLPLTEARHAFFGRFTAAETWLAMSEALARRGNARRCGRHFAECRRQVPRRSAIVDRARQCARRSCARPDAACGAGIPPCGRGGAGHIPRQRFSTVWLWHVRATRRPPSRCGSRCWRWRRKTQVGVRWSSRVLRRSVDRAPPAPQAATGS